MKISLPEHITLEFKVAGWGSRVLAYIFDLIIRWAAFVLLFFSIFLLFSLATHLSIIEGILYLHQTFQSIAGDLSFALVIFTIYVVEICYPIYFEVWGGGATPGKRLCSLRVVDENGLPLTFQKSFLRSAFLLLDILPGMGLVGLISILLTEKSQRLGDILAKTIVVFEEQVTFPQKTSALELESELIELPAALYSIIEEFLMRRKFLQLATREKIEENIKQGLDRYLHGNLRERFTSNLSQGGSSDFIEWVYSIAKPGREVF